MANNLRVVSRTVSSLVIAWDPPIFGNVMAYAISIQGLPGTEQTVSARANRSAVFDGLVAGRPYIVGVVSVSGDVSSDSLDEEFYTSK